MCLENWLLQPLPETTIRSSMWPQASGELLGFIQALDRRKMGITADQLRMALQLAEITFRQLKFPIDLTKTNKEEKMKDLKP